MPQIAPSITAYSPDEYRDQMETAAKFAHRVHIDLMDDEFTKKPNISAKDAWWPVGTKADFHLMYKQPGRAVELILEHKPNMIIVHAESSGRFIELADRLHQLSVLVGVALLPQTSVETIAPALEHIDHVLVFSGDLGVSVAMPTSDY